jgi:hypothetical protein
MSPASVPRIGAATGKSGESVRPATSASPREVTARPLARSPSVPPISLAHARTVGAESCKAPRRCSACPVEELHRCRAGGVAADALAPGGTESGEVGRSSARDSGLRGVDDRVVALDGPITVDSDRGRCTTVRATIACAEQPQLAALQLIDPRTGLRRTFFETP